MPQIGDIKFKESLDGSRASGIKRNRWIFTGCQECGKTRWILLWHYNKGLMKYCQLCSLKYMNFNSNSTHWGASNNHWKGGRKISKDGYVSILIRSDSIYFPMVTNNRGHSGYILEHRMLMAQKLGRLLERFELVHHVDGNRGNNDMENLQLTTASKHELSYRDGYIAGFNAGRALSVPLIKLDGGGSKRVRVEV